MKEPINAYKEQSFLAKSPCTSCLMKARLPFLVYEQTTDPSFAMASYRGRRTFNFLKGLLTDQHIIQSTLRVIMHAKIRYPERGGQYQRDAIDLSHDDGHVDVMKRTNKPCITSTSTDAQGKEIVNNDSYEPKRATTGLRKSPTHLVNAQYSGVQFHSDTK